MKPTSSHAAATRRCDSVRQEGGVPQLDRQAGQSAAQDAAHIPKKRLSVILWPGLTALGVCLFWMVLDWRTPALPPPFEDAAMLFKYAENLAHGNGITWNSGQDPGLTDGATDLGFVLAIAPLAALGFPAALAALVIDLAAVFGIGALFGALNSRLWHQAPWLPIAVAALVASVPTSRYVLSGYSPPVMGFLLLGAFTLAVAGALARTHQHSLLLLAAAGAAAGLAGWWRPEGFVFGPLAVLSALLITKHAGRRPLSDVSTATVLLTPFVLLVLAWTTLRVTYFGHLFPTSAVMKAGSLHPWNALYSVQFYGSLLLPVVGVLLVLATGRDRMRNWWLSAAVLIASLVWINGGVLQSTLEDRGLAFVSTLSDLATVALFIPVLLVIAVAGVRRRDGSWMFPLALVTFSLAWVAIATTLNTWGRMQWPLVPVLAGIGVASATAATVGHSAPTRRDSSTRRTPVVVLALLSCVGVLPFAISGDYRSYGGFYTFHRSVASALEVVDTSHVRLATTEAGLIPLAVTGPSLDTWGHNNRSIAATHGRSLWDEMTAFQPNMLAVHGLPPDAVQPPDCPQRRAVSSRSPFEDDWSHMVTTLYNYAREHRFILARISETSACETWSLWLSAEVDPQIRRAIDQLQMPGTELHVSRTS